MTKGLTYNELEKRAEEMESRLEHLLQSKTIQLFDEVRPQTGEYRRDIRRLDTYGVHYKMREFERTGRVPLRCARVVQVRTKDIARTAEALERLTEAIKEAKNAWNELFEDGEGSYEITPEVVK
jgi:hypothetical protein